MKSSRVTAVCTIFNLALVSGLFLFGFSSDQETEVIEARQIVLHSGDSGSSIEIGCDDNLPKMVMRNSEGEVCLEIIGGKNPEISFKEEAKPTFRIIQKNGHSELALGDVAKSDKVLLNGGQSSGFFMKNSEDKIIGTWTTLSDGGSAFGLADRRGFAASILRGGSNPSVSFFSPNNEPKAAMGMIQQVPHLLISGPVGNEGILIHGGKSSSMLFVDEVGKVKILISKNGVFQGSGKGKPSKEEEKSEQKVFSMEDQNLLFPDSEKTSSPCL